jgi:anti-anti-sigma regulatory factor
MNILASKAVGKVDVTVLRLEGELDGQTYESLIARVKDVYNAGSRNFLIDLTDLTYISSAGLVALHSAALLVRGEALPDAEAGWSSIRSVGSRGALGKQEHIKLFNPREEVKSVLEMVGFDSSFDIFTDFDKAVNSF